jgi:hypothetical protein
MLLTGLFSFVPPSYGGSWRKTLSCADSGNVQVTAPSGRKKIGRGGKAPGIFNLTNRYKKVASQGHCRDVLPSGTVMAKSPCRDSNPGCPACNRVVLLTGARFTVNFKTLKCVVGKTASLPVSE